MDTYSQRDVSLDMGQDPTTSVRLDELCELLRAAEPIVWSIAIVFAILGNHFNRSLSVAKKMCLEFFEMNSSQAVGRQRMDFARAVSADLDYKSGLPVDDSGPVPEQVQHL